MLHRLVVCTHEWIDGSGYVDPELARKSAPASFLMVRSVLPSLSGTSQDKRATVSNSKSEDDDANTLSALCRPGLILSSDDSELVQRECGVLAWPDRTNQY